MVALSLCPGFHARALLERLFEEFVSIDYEHDGAPARHVAGQLRAPSSQWATRAAIPQMDTRESRQGCGRMTHHVPPAVAACERSRRH